MGGIGAGMAACALPLAARSRPAALPLGSPLPPRLRPGDVVGLIEPAGFSDDQAEVAAVAAMIEAMGLVPRVGAHVAARHGYLAGTDRQRADDLNAMYADPEVRAVFAVRGGWGSARMLPLVDWAVVRANPKLLIGYSDITALHLAIAARAGFPTIHGPNAANSWGLFSWNSLWHLAFAGIAPMFGPLDMARDGVPGVTPWQVQTVTGGKARGRLLGGNLTVLTGLVGTPYLADLSGAVLFLEDTGEAEYRVDRMLAHLALAGILGKVAGVVFGQCTRCSSGLTDYSGLTLDQVLADHLAPLGVPVITGANIGHVANQLCLPSGGMVELDADERTLRVMAPIVA